MISNEIKELDAYKYAVDVCENKIVACELIALSCKRFLLDLERTDLEFRYKIGKRFEKFCGLVKHFKGNANGKPFKLERWQKFLVYNLLCWYYKKTDKRRFTKALICISRKQGKSALAAILCLWFLLCDDEGSPECDLSANSQKQAMVAFEFVEEFARQLDPKGKTIKRFRKYITTDRINKGKLNVFASDSTKLDGFNASFFLVDEAGGARDTKMYDVLRSSQGQRKNPLGMIISTAGFDLSAPFYNMVQVGKEVLRGIKEDDSYFYMIFELDENDDYTDENVWQKVMPNLDVTCERQFVREEIINAKNNVESEVSILTKTFNKWCSTSTTFIPTDYVMKVMQKVNVEDFDENCIAYFGIDMASTSDLTCISMLVIKPNDEKLYFKNFYFLPSETINISPNRAKYKNWLITKQLNQTIGNVTDYDEVLRVLKTLCENVCVQKIGYDDWNATQFVINATNEGLPMTPISQSISSLTKPTKTLERLIKKGMVVIDSNEINLWCFQNSAPKVDFNENVRIIKGGGKDQKIDGVVAMIMALATYLKYPNSAVPRIYTI